MNIYAFYVHYSAGESDLPGLPDAESCCIAVGLMRVSKGRQGQEAENHVHVLLAAIRIPKAGSDILVTLHTPCLISERSTAAEHAGPGPKELHHAAPALLRAILKGLTIQDFSLFG